MGPCPLGSTFYPIPGGWGCGWDCGCSGTKRIFSSGFFWCVAGRVGDWELDFAPSRAESPETVKASSCLILSSPTGERGRSRSLLSGRACLCSQAVYLSWLWGPRSGHGRFWGCPAVWSKAGVSPVGARQLVPAGSGAWDQWGWGRGLVPHPHPPGLHGPLPLLETQHLGYGSPRPFEAPDQAGRKQD